MQAGDFYSIDITPFQPEVAPVWKIAVSWSTIWPYVVAIALLAVVTAARPALTREPATPPPPSGSVNHG
jgi:hypothetical protein